MNKNGKLSSTFSLVSSAPTLDTAHRSQRYWCWGRVATTFSELPLLNAADKLYTYYWYLMAVTPLLAGRLFSSAFWDTNAGCA